jgi:deazaflavin-dependent oxidoreductase (nitroreductase family)
MMSTRQKFERNFFRNLNRVVEPAVRKGALSPRYAPVGLIVLESIGFKSGAVRSTPLLATRIGTYTFVSTVRGKKSFWVKNLQKNPDIRFHMGGRVKEARSFVFASDNDLPKVGSLPPLIAAIAARLVRRGPDNLTLAVLRTES